MVNVWAVMSRRNKDGQQPIAVEAQRPMPQYSDPSLIQETKPGYYPEYPPEMPPQGTEYGNDQTPLPTLGQDSEIIEPVMEEQIPQEPIIEVESIQDPEVEVQEPVVEDIPMDQQIPGPEIEQGISE